MVLVQMYHGIWYTMVDRYHVVLPYLNKNSSGDEIVNVNLYAVRPEATRIRWNNAK